jgi:hypothetical protein
MKLKSINNNICFIDNIFYFKIFSVIKNKYNTTFIKKLLIHYIFKRWGYIYPLNPKSKNHVDFKYFYLQNIV